MDNRFSSKSRPVRTNKRLFLSDLVLYECVADNNLKFSVKIEKESILKQLFIQH